MRKGLLFKFLLVVTMLFSMAMQCNKDCSESCYTVDAAVYVQDTADLFDWVENMENDEVIWKKTAASVDDTSWIPLWLDPTRSRSTFIFGYDHKDSDTVVVTHHFEEAYSEKCEEYYLKKEAAELEQNSFGEKLIFDNRNQCSALEILLY